MKRYIYSVVAMLVVCSACKKDATTKAPEKLVQVNFHVGFEQSTGVFNVTNKTSKLRVNSLTTNAVDSTLKANVDVLYAAIYQSDGTRLFLTKQLSTDTAFGKINFNVPAGNYTVAFAGGKTGLGYGSYNGALANESLSYGVIDPSTGNYDYHFRDTFFDKINLTVGPTGFSQNISMHRITSQIIVNIEDAIPQNVKFWTFSANDPGGLNNIPDYRVATETAEGNDGVLFANTSPTIPLTTGVKNSKLGILVLNSARPYSLHLVATNTLPSGVVPNSGVRFLGDVIGEAVIPNVVVQPNHQTYVTGKLFGGLGTTNSGNFTITVDPTWDPTPTTIPFQ